MKFECAACGQHVSAATEQAGMAFPCPNCGAELTVPEPESGMDGDEVVPIPPVKGHHFFRRRWFKWTMVGVLVLVLSLGSLVAGYVAGFRSAYDIGFSTGRVLGAKQLLDNIVRSSDLTADEANQEWKAFVTSTPSPPTSSPAPEESPVDKATATEKAWREFVEALSQMKEQSDNAGVSAIQQGGDPSTFQRNGRVVIQNMVATLQNISRDGIDSDLDSFIDSFSKRLSQDSETIIENSSSDSDAEQVQAAVSAMEDINNLLGTIRTMRETLSLRYGDHFEAPPGY